MLELGDVRRGEAQAAGLGFRVLGKRFLEAEFSFIFALFLQGVD